MGCKRQGEHRKGNEVILKCTNRSCESFGKIVSREHCGSICPMIVLDVRTDRSIERKPDMQVKEPVLDGCLLLCEYTPNGFSEVEPGKQKCNFPECDSLTRQASLLKDGKLKFHFFCGGKPTTQKDCERCQAGDTPGYLKQLRNYAHATTAWVKDNMPKRTDSEVIAILEVCKSCDYYNKAKGQCKICGCRLNTSATAVANKIRMATEHCPKGKW